MAELHACTGAGGVPDVSRLKNPGFRFLWLIVLPADTNALIQPLPSSTVTYNRTTAQDNIQIF